MPSRERRAIFHQIARCPEDSSFVLIARGLVILAENIKLVSLESLYQPIRDLF